MGLAISAVSQSQVERFGLPAFVTKAPNDDTWMISVSQDHPRKPGVQGVHAVFIEGVVHLERYAGAHAGSLFSLFVFATKSRPCVCHTTDCII